MGLVDNAIDKSGGHFLLRGKKRHISDLRQFVGPGESITGALMQKKGRFELADGGTLFLDEIGDIPLELQAKLLGVLQEQEFERLGSTSNF